MQIVLIVMQFYMITVILFIIFCIIYKLLNNFDYLNLFILVPNNAAVNSLAFSKNGQ
jgi:uncharacterized membrane protein YjfL (UPF0719 family)